MGWLSKIFKGSNPKISKGHYNHGNYGEDFNSYVPSSSRDMWSGCECEDIDRATALSLPEETQKGKGKNVLEDSQLDEDEQLARALQQSLIVESPSSYGHGGTQYGNGNGNTHGNLYQPTLHYFPTGFRICAGCNTDIGCGKFLSCMNGVWHPQCFRCHACNQPISEYEIPTNPAGLIEYRAHPFWAQKYCPSHEHDHTPRCCSCERMEPRDTSYVALNDSRKLCLECLDSSLMETSSCQPLYLEIQEFYESLNMKIDQQVPIYLVEREALNEAREGEKNGHYHMPETRGLCLSEEQTVSTILKRPKYGAGDLSSNTRAEPYKLMRRCDVTAILIIYGLPRLLTGSILAHEMMHAWLRLKGFRTLSPDVEEGICQVLAHMWLDRSGSGSNEVSTSSSFGSRMSHKVTRSPFQRKMWTFFKHQIESDTSPVYGDGFRAGQRAVLKYGLGRTLEHIRVTGTFPY